jgi:hypothetical protein
MILNLRSALEAALIIVFAALLEAQPQQQPPLPSADVHILSATGTPKGVKIKVTVRNTHTLRCDVLKADAETGEFSVRFLKNLEVPLSGSQLDSQDPVTDILLLPVAVDPDPGTQYQLQCWGHRPEEGSSWTGPVKKEFKGYPALISDTIRMTFTSSGLKISADTPKQVIKLAAAWQVTGKEKVDWNASAEGESPGVTLPYASLEENGKPPKSVPSMILALRDDTTGRIQEARITVAVEATGGAGPRTTQSVREALETIRDQRPGDRGRVRFAWAAVGRTGLGAILRYFALF